MRGLAHVAALVVAVAACGPIPADRDAYATRDRGPLGLPVLSFQWKFEVSDETGTSKPQQFASPALYGEQLVLGSSSGHLYSLSTRGEVLWRVELGSVNARPAIDPLRGRIYIGSDDGSLVCLQASDGAELWRYTTRGPILQMPVLSDGLVLFSNEADQVYALDSDTGKFRWQYKTETPEEYTMRGHAGVAVSDGLVFSGFSNGTLVALRQNTGSVAWLTSLKGDAERFVDVDGTPVVSGDTVYATSSAGGAFALDRTTGLIRWRLAIDGAGPLTADGARVYVGAADQGMHAVDRSGNIVWRQGTYGGGEPGRPVVSKEYLIYPLSDDGLFIANRRTGQLYQYFDPGDGISAQPTVDDYSDRLYVVSNRGFLYAFDVNRF